MQDMQCAMLILLPSTTAKSRVLKSNAFQTVIAHCFKALSDRSKNCALMNGRLYSSFFVNAQFLFRFQITLKIKPFLLLIFEDRKFAAEARSPRIHEVDVTTQFCLHVKWHRYLGAKFAGASKHVQEAKSWG